MSWTKRQFINQAFDEIAIANYEFDLSPEMLQSALRRMDSMVAVWNVKGIKIGYPLPESPSDSSLDDATNIPDSANEAIYTNLAIRIAPSQGKIVSAETKMIARSSYNALLSDQSSPPPPVQLPHTMPLGAGNRRNGNRQNYVTPPQDYIATGTSGVLDFY